MLFQIVLHTNPNFKLEFITQVINQQCIKETFLLLCHEKTLKEWKTLDLEGGGGVHDL